VIKYEIRLRSGRIETNTAPTDDDFQIALGKILSGSFYIGTNFAVNVREIEWVRKIDE
jgi:hypothetical protein